MKPRIDSNSGREGQRRQNMNWDAVGNDWENFKDAVHEHWQWLSDEQLAGIGGRRERLSHELQRTYALSPREAEQEIQDFEEGRMTVAGMSSGRGPTERAREFGAGNNQGGSPQGDKHSFH